MSCPCERVNMVGIYKIHTSDNVKLDDSRCGLELYKCKPIEVPGFKFNMNNQELLVSFKYKVEHYNVGYEPDDVKMWIEQLIEVNEGKVRCVDRVITMQDEDVDDDAIYEEGCDETPGDSDEEDMMSIRDEENNAHLSEYYANYHSDDEKDHYGLDCCK